MKEHSITAGLLGPRPRMIGRQALLRKPATLEINADLADTHATRPND